MAEGKVYDIPAPGYQWFKDKLETLAKRAKKLTGERLFLTLVGFHKDEDVQSPSYGQRINEVFVAFPEPKLAGWEFVARIDHASETGNILRTTGLRELPLEYRNSEPTCDHCQHKRRRRDTFVVFNEELNSWKQVGSSCLKDFLGHGDADKWAKMAEMIATIGEFARGSRNQGVTGLANLAWVDTLTFMGLCAESVLNRGFTSKKTSRETGRDSTAEDVWARYHSSLSLISDPARNLAQAALDWAQGLEGELTDYQHNCQVIANCPALEPRSIGIAASIVGVYYAGNKTSRGNGDFQGVVGKKLEIEATVTEVRELSNSYLHRLQDAQGNAYTWFATKPALRGSLGRSVAIRGTVKEHQTYRGKKSTVLTRVKAI